MLNDDPISRKLLKQLKLRMFLMNHLRGEVGREREKGKKGKAIIFLIV
jgi:hypothetical protein